ncbi:MAG: transport permease protein [Herpetosiphonaceae bacterium]|nr:MAG: transport permease protein [Herpetosiphonaceae bacterium]
MARVVKTEAISATSDKRRPLHGYHWLMIVLSLVISLAVAMPTLLSQPPLYLTSAEVTVDPARYGLFFSSSGCPNVEGRQAVLCLAPAYNQIVQQPAAEMLRHEFQRFGTRYVNLIPEDMLNGRIRLTAQALDPTQARDIANRGAHLVAQHIRAAAGRDLLRRLMGHQLYLMYQGQPAENDFDRQIREILAYRVFDITPELLATRPQLSAEDFDDIIRALEVRDDELSMWRRRADLSIQEKNHADLAQRTLRPILLNLQREHRRSETEPSAAFISAQATIPLQPVPQHLLLKSILVFLIGLAGGVLAVAVDRTINIIAKLRELWSYRELIGNLVARDLKARYKGSFLGYLWSLVNPLLMMAIFYVVFRVLLRTNITYFHIFLMAALLPWNFCAGAIMEGMGSIVNNAALVKKVYFPREILPLAAVLSNLINFLLALPVLFFVILLTGASLGWSALFLPVIIIMETIFLLGMALVLSSAAVFFRDTQHIMGVLMQLWFFLTPIFYALEDVVPRLAPYVRWFNPMASLVDFYRDILYGGVARDGALPTPGLPALDGVARTALTVLMILGIGVYIFHRSSGRFGEEL